MSAFWSHWIRFLVVLNLGITLFLFLWGQVVKIPTRADGTSGHVWAHGALREGVRRLPLWWVLVSASLFVVAFGYLVRYPGFGAWRGTTGWTAHGQLARETAANDARLDPVLKQFDGMSVEQLAATPEATRMGRRLFVDNCAACHGHDGRGGRAIGAPDLTDSDWLWGGTAQTIMTTILDGRTGVMPPFGGAMSARDIEHLAYYVLSLSGPSATPALAEQGKEKFVVCTACHGPEGKGNPALGAPNLTYAKRLYGDDIPTLERTIRDGRTGTMPAWRQRLGERNVRLIAAWIYAQSHGAARTAAR
ncbi:MAG: cytochrome-c oxidase, cbb3-type subunit III [Proteobacteria bacterium]|nr:cytochrome-c oxidase, cbb3-type subunit III [Pseudomonadota bacterium]